MDHEGNPGRLGGTPIVGVFAVCDDSQRLPRVPVPYKGVPKNKVDNVFRKACQLRFRHPTPDDIILATKTDLCYRTVSAILSPEGTLQRQQKATERARRAKDAELAFINLLISIDTKFLREDEQKERIVASIKAGDIDIIRVTPDVLFTQPTNVCGFTCHWIEYKDTFGFRGDPFVAARNKKQLRKYATIFGTGMVVHKLGFECGRLQLEGVCCLREAEVVESRRRADPSQNPADTENSQTM
ncbi:hypothetical protein LTR12_018275 [Friedmanniomyces endolithicus]|nr:hypothetical protein LTR12_018275 [Friedmanniomyces endolithicus]